MDHRNTTIDYQHLRTGIRRLRKGNYLWTIRAFCPNAIPQFSKCNVPCVLPSVERGTMVVIPPEQIIKAYGHPESILDVAQHLE